MNLGHVIMKSTYRHSMRYNHEFELTKPIKSLTELRVGYHDSVVSGEIEANGIFKRIL